MNIIYKVYHGFSSTKEARDDFDVFININIMS